MTDASTYDGPEWDELSTVLGAYLYQDWSFEYDTMWDAVRDFRDSEPAPVVAAVAVQVRRILDADHDEAELETVLDQLGIEYNPPGDGWTYRDWLTELEKFLRSASMAEDTV